MVGSLLVSVGAVCIRARMERRYGPAVIAAIAAIAIVTGRFVFHSPAVVYAGSATLFGAAMFRFALERIRWQKPLVS